MTFQAGTKLGSYEIVGPLGAGGMGEVYRARDSKLKRDVALKVLPDEFSRDSQRLSRFQREAEVLASLNHPHIAGIYDLADFEECRFLVLELVLGETLAERIGRGPIAIDDVLHLARQIAEAVEAAHEKGVTHRDLKPANIKITPDRKVKVLDFGLAKMSEAQGTGATPSNLSTMTILSTPGMILGTAAYMSPEQVNGNEADRTSDVWAFGCVLYEMLTGRALFGGETVGEILASVLKSDPDWNRLPDETPAGIRRLLRRCLQKDRKLRFHDMTDVRIEIEEARSETPMDGQVVRAGGRGWPAGWIAALAILTLIAIAVVAMVWAFRPVPSAPEMRVDVSTPPTMNPESLAISPNGQRIVFASTIGGQSRLWLRSLDSDSARVLAGTDDGLAPFWSPDSRSIGFFAHGKLQRLDIDTGSAQVLANASYGHGGTWNPEGIILFTPNPGSPILKVAVTGGEATEVTRVEAPQQFGHAFPQFLPDGRHFLYYVLGSPQARGIYVGQLGGSETKRLLDADTAAVYATSGQLLFVRQSTLLSQPFDPIRLELAGNLFPVAERIVVQGQSAAVSASGAGSIVYRTGATVSGQRQFIWFDRAGREVGKAGEPLGQSGANLSPDGRRVALFKSVDANVDLWVLDTLRGVSNRFTFDTADEIFPVWSPDGARIAFSSNRNGGIQNLYQKSATGVGSEDLLLATPQGTTLTDWSTDSRFLLYMTPGPKTGPDIWVLPLMDRKPFPIAQTNFDEQLAQFSPDGKWIAYQSNESGRFEIYIQPFSGANAKPEAKLRISTNGGAQVRWRHDGQELFYIELDGRLMAVPIRFASNGGSIEPGAPVPLFATRVGGALQPYPRFEYMVSPDDQRFLLNTLTEEASSSPMTLILNWKAKPLAK